ncbi:hypothetical protein TWF694_008958 [Orbilia ellipsospora]|uniref:Uncharacterized protein n=1 Tax=Orbilia ellipsospora TaxID=2528407 RepID=A0AAV9XDJ4_9PEZI
MVLVSYLHLRSHRISRQRVRPRLHCANHEHLLSCRCRGLSRRNPVCAESAQRRYFGTADRAIGIPPGPYLLLTIHPESRQDDMTIKKFSGFISCNYVGPVHVIGEQGIFQSMEDGSVGLQHFLIGRQSDGYLRKVTSDPESATFYLGSTSTPYACRFVKDHIWIGDQFFRGDLLIPTTSPPDKNESRDSAKAQDHGTTMNCLLIRQHDNDGAQGITVTLNPRFKISSGGAITNISTDWPSENLKYSAIELDMIPLWPPRTIAADTRGKSFAFETKMKSASETLFRVEAGDLTLIYAALSNDLLQSSDEFPYRGVWACFYSDEEFELHLFQQTSKHTITATKLTSIHSEKPRGMLLLRVTFPQNEATTEVSNAANSPKICKGEFAGASYLKHGEFTSHAWMKRELRFISADAIDVMPSIGDSTHLKYRRIPGEVLSLK